MVSSWTSTSSLGFPGGSLGPWNKLAWGCLSVGLLGHNLHLVVLDNATSLPLVELRVCDLLMCNICILLLYELLHVFVSYSLQCASCSTSLGLFTIRVSDV